MCEKQPVYPNEPQIDYLQITIKDTVDILGNEIKLFSIFFNVLDGDGNFGIKTEDTLIDYYGDSLYANNFFATLYYLDNGVQTEYDIELSLNGAIPYTPPVGLNIYYKAMVIYDLSLPKLTDSLKLKFYIIDRNTNESNKQETQWIAPDFLGTMVDTVTVIEY